MDKKDLYIKSKLQEDKKVSNQANEVFKKFEGGINLENNNKQKERKVIKISLQQAILAFTSFAILIVLGGNLYAHIMGKPNIYSAIKGLFIKEAKYTSSEVEINQTKESNGVKLTLKTVAMDENVLVTKYVAEGEKLANEFYTYQDLEDAEIEINKILLAKIGIDIGEKENYASKDESKLMNEVISKLQKAGITKSEAQKMQNTARLAYNRYVGAELGLEGEEYTADKAKQAIQEVIAMFESKISSQYAIISSNDKLEGFEIKPISQRIEKSGNSYVIYNIYNVDTITDLAKKFTLNIKINKIGNISGKWNFETKLEKARLDTRVETIEFYENNVATKIAPSITVKDEIQHTATVNVKKLVISDFSSVLMIQTKVDYIDRDVYLKYGDNGLPCIYVVTDEQGNTLGTGVCSRDTYSSATRGGDIVYTDRILLNNVDKDTKKLYIKIYEQYSDQNGQYKLQTRTMELDIEAARSGKKPVELTQSYASKKQQVAFKYPVDWKVSEEDAIRLMGPEDLDGQYVDIKISKLDNAENKELKELAEESHPLKEKIVEQDYIIEQGEKTIAGNNGYYIKSKVGSEIYYGNYVVMEKDDNYYGIEYSAEILTQYTRYEDIFEKILETIKFEEPEKSYKIFSNGSNVTLKLYEDNNLTISLSKTLTDFFKSENSRINLEPNIEYTVTNVPSNITNIKIVLTHQDLSMENIYVMGDRGLYYLTHHNVAETGKFELKQIENLKNEKVVDVKEVEYNTEEYNYIAKNLEEGGNPNWHIASTVSGKKYIIDPVNLTAVEYKKQEENKPTTQNTTDAQAKEVIQKFLSIWEAYEAEPRVMLEREMPDYITANMDDRDRIEINGISYINTNASYDAFEREMMQYMNYEIFNQYFSKWYKNNDGILYVAELGASGSSHIVTEIERVKKSGNEYEYKVYVNATYIDQEDNPIQETYSFHLGDLEGKLFVTFMEER